MVRIKKSGDTALGQRLTWLMEQQGLLPTELAARTGISESYLSRLLRGTVTNPTLDFILRLAAGLGVTVTELLSAQPGQSLPHSGHPAAAQVATSLFSVEEADVSPRAAMPVVRRVLEEPQDVAVLSEQLSRIVIGAGLSDTNRRRALRLIVATARVICYELAAEGAANDPAGAGNEERG